MATDKAGVLGLCPACQWPHGLLCAGSIGQRPANPTSIRWRVFASSFLCLLCSDSRNLLLRPSRCHGLPCGCRAQLELPSWVPEEKVSRCGQLAGSHTCWPTLWFHPGVRAPVYTRLSGNGRWEAGRWRQPVLRVPHLLWPPCCSPVPTDPAPRAAGAEFLP